MIVTNLSLMNRLRYRRLYRYSGPEIAVTFWTDAKDGYLVNSFDEAAFQAWAHTLGSQRKYASDIHELDVVFEAKRSIVLLRHEDSGRQAMHLDDLLTLENCGGYVDHEQVSRGRFIIYVRLLDISAQDVADLEIARKDALLADVREHIVSIVPRTLIHEFAHLAHLRRQEVSRIVARYRERMKGFKRRIDISDQGWDAIIMMPKINTLRADRKSLERMLFDIFVNLRARLFHFKVSIYAESMSEFIGMLEEGNLDSDAVQRIAGNSARSFVDAFDQLLDDISAWVVSIRAESANQQKEHIFLQAENERRADRIRYTVQTILHKVKPYQIGVVMPMTLYTHGMALDDIFDLSMDDMYNAYERICHKEKIRPAIALRPGAESCLSIGDMILRLNALRKKLDIRA